MKANLRKNNTKIKYRFADVKEAQELYLSNTKYLNNLNQYDLDYRLNKKNATLEEFKSFGASQTNIRNGENIRASKNEFTL